MRALEILNMAFDVIKSYAKINLALNITGKKKLLHKVESIIAFVDLYDLIKIKQVNSNNHNISFKGKFSKGIGSNNTISKLIKLLEKKYENVSIPRPPHWGGLRLRPKRIEFWHDGEFRLHDRFIFEKATNTEGWEITRLNP